MRGKVSLGRLVDVQSTLRRPGRTVFPLYAGTLPIASVIQLPVPLPSPFNTLSSLLGAVALGLGAVHVVFRRQLRVPSLPTAVWLLFLGWISLTAFWSIDPETSLSTLTVAVPLMALLFV